MKRKSFLVGLVIAVLIASIIAYQYGRFPLEKKLARAQGKIQQLENELTQAQEKIQELEQKLTRAQEKIQELEQELEKARKPLENAWLSVYFYFPREIDQVTYFQTVEKVSVSSNILPSGITTLTDEYGNTYVAVYWQEEQTGNITVSLETIIFRKERTITLNTSDPYPVPKDLLPGDINIYLQPTKYIQSDDPLIISLAQNLTQGLTRQVDVVNSTLKWISENIEWKDPALIENYRIDAVGTFKQKGGNCVNFATLMTALFRAQGIPARIAKGIVWISKPNDLISVKTSVLHLWVEVFYPQMGWILYDTWSDRHYGIQLQVLPGGGFSPYPLHAGEALLKYQIFREWEIIMLEKNKVRFTCTLKITPKD